MKKAPALDRIDAIDQETGCVNVIIETPKGSHNKYKYDGKLAAFTLGGVLPPERSFRSISASCLRPSARMAIARCPHPARRERTDRCLVKARLIGAIEAEQTEPKGKRIRNDRLLAVAFPCSHTSTRRKLGDLRRKLLDEVAAFFIDYDAQRGKRFKPLRRSGPHQTMKLLRPV